MKCPFCRNGDTAVIDSRLTEDGSSVRRRRRCPECEKRFTTFEVADLQMPVVVKQDGSRSAFDIDKVRTGFNRALHKRPVPADLVEAALGHIQERLVAMGTREVPSREIGEMVMRELRKLDKVAYIRFASVYRSFEGVDDFRDAIEEVESPRRRRPKRD